MSKHCCKHEHDECCYTMPMGGYGYGMTGGGGGGCGSGWGGSWGIRWIYALLILIVIVLQFARRPVPAVVASTGCDDGAVTTPVAGAGFFGGFGEDGLIDRSVLFIIVVFLLILCTGCWTGGFGNYGAAGTGSYAGYGGYGY